MSSKESKVLDWILKHNATLERDIYLDGRPVWRVIIRGRGQIAFGGTPHEAMAKAMENLESNKEAP